MHADRLRGLFRRRKRVADVSEAFRRLRACYPRRRLFVIMDNLHNVHDHLRFLALLRQPAHPPSLDADRGFLAQRHRSPLRHQARDLDRFGRSRARQQCRRRIYRYLRYRNHRVGQATHPLTRIRSIRPLKLERH